MKSVDEKTFKECVDKMLRGRMHPDVAAYLCGLSRPTFNLRVNQYYDPDRYGELPEGFFDGRKEFWKENEGWIKNRPAIVKYLKRQEERKQHEEYMNHIDKRNKHMDEFMDASKLPKLGD